MSHDFTIYAKFHENPRNDLGEGIRPQTDGQVDRCGFHITLSFFIGNEGLKKCKKICIIVAECGAWR
jgi:hypothetical protein